MGNRTERRGGDGRVNIKTVLRDVGCEVLEVNRTGSGLCPVGGFGIRGFGCLSLSFFENSVSYSNKQIVGIREIRYEGENWIQLGVDKESWRIRVNTILYIFMLYQSRAFPDNLGYYQLLKDDYAAWI